ncbi:helix-turn-helix domain-containing protein [Stappia sp. F7233]|uniref:Helix-turn-helix domain-containing protein n=1 Tax=Stappia albiluteola TaxID=2758565 RepID=A0A839AK65_9HYPH|nr:helix-turn-helix domain-containing protein [Stappia albiluteola]MBA5778859.1 helix-turn-helix domain-containing protein [Stappia albiluteola]
MNRASVTVPDYALYGEPAGTGFPDALHVEAIADRSGPRRWRIAVHRHHALHQLFWISRGGGTVYLDETSFHMEAPTLLNMPAGIAHGFRFLPATEGAVITVPVDLFEPLRAEVDPADRLRRVALVNDVVEPPAMLDELFAEHRMQRPYRVAALKAHIGLLATWCARQVIGGKGGLETGEPGRSAALLVRFRALVEERFASEHRISAFADALGVTLSHLTRLCRSRYGRSAGAMLRDRQMLEARRLLAYTQMGVADIAYRLGFSDPAYFSRVFASAAGRSPSAFRRGFTERPG